MGSCCVWHLPAQGASLTDRLTCSVMSGFLSWWVAASQHSLSNSCIGGVVEDVSMRLQSSKHLYLPTPCRGKPWLCTLTAGAGKLELPGRLSYKDTCTWTSTEIHRLQGGSSGQRLKIKGVVRHGRAPSSSPQPRGWAHSLPWHRIHQEGHQVAVKAGKRDAAALNLRPVARLWQVPHQRLDALLHAGSAVSPAWHARVCRGCSLFTRKRCRTGRQASVWGAQTGRRP